MSMERAFPRASSSDAKASSSPIIFVLGGPGSGKGTNCSKIVDEFGYTHLCAGDLLRKEADSGSEKGKEVKEIMRQGALVPSEVTITLLERAIKSRPNSSGFLIDGFPREIRQAMQFEKQVGECQAVLVFDCSECILKERVLKRGKASGRVDDNEESITKRLASHTTTTLPVIEYYQQLRKVHTINSERTIKEVYADVRTVFKTITDHKK